ncbi:hypothetical protein D3C75_1009620 [compost metagenome]
MIAEATTGFPPNVVACVPGEKTSRKYSLANIAPAGNPLAIPFADVKISGSIP